MSSALALLALLAPAALCLPALLSRFESGPRPRLVAAASRHATWLALALAALAGLTVAWHGPQVSPVLGVGDVGLMIRLDVLSAVMFGLVTFIGLLVVRFSRNYLAGDPRRGTLLAGMCLALAAVILLVLAGNLYQLVAAWIAASIALERLLLFYRERRGARAAVRRKRLFARLGDVCLIAAAVLLARAFGTTDIGAILEQARALTGAAVPTSVQLAALLLAVAALLKSAQIPAHGWLPAAMDTPTPVSALLHAGMINAGGFLVIRFADLMLLSASSLHLLAIVGGATAVIASVIMLTQTSVKASLAYSTVAQMGFMLLECGLGAFSLAVLHLVAHSLYKAHAFLASGSIVEALRAFRGPATPAPSPARIAACLAAAAATFAAVAALLGVSPTEQPVIIGFGAIVALGLTHLIVRACQGEPSGRVLGRTFAAAAATALAYLALETGVARLLASTLPAPPASDTTIAILAAVVLGFAAVIVVQLRVPAGGGSRRWHRAYLLLRSGLHVDVWGTWLAQRTTRWTTRRRDAAPSPVSTGAPALDVDAALRRTADKIAPLWPLDHFVAVNPFLGLQDAPFAEAAATMTRVAGARMTLPRAFYREAIDAGRITRADLAEALAEAPAGAPASIAALRRRAGQDAEPTAMLPTVADVATEVTGFEWAAVTTDRMSAWAAAYFDGGQATWRSPWRDLSPLAAWRAEVLLDRGPELLGLAGFRAWTGRLPETTTEVVTFALARLGLPAAAVEPYLHRLAMTIGGWAGHARYRGWRHELAGQRDDTLVELLAIRLAWDVALLDLLAQSDLEPAWVRARTKLAASAARASDELVVDLVLHAAHEKATQRTLFATMTSPAAAARTGAGRPDVQAAFCIDVRSEVFRRALESTDPGIETLGVAGFFGVAAEWIPLGDTGGHAHCPVLLAPGHVVREAHEDGEPTTARLATLRQLRRRAAAAWKSFKLAAVASFSFVEAVGLGYALRLVTDSLGWTRPVPDPRHHGLARRERRLRPSLAAARIGTRAAGIDLDTRAQLAEGLLTAMSLTDGLARLVVLTGHGATTVNNPYATSLDCGACGGQSGEASARIAAAVLNDARVRAALAARDIAVPGDTVFVAALHDTTTDEVTLFDRDTVPPTHVAELMRLQARLADAARLARAERARRFPGAARQASDTAILARSRDWSQVRPEWGLAGCAAFVVAPRHRTAGRGLAGRAFLHSYDWRRDDDFGVLELIMTAPMVVASWINLQYYASAVDNDVFGCGNKVLHNVVGGLGVLEGASGDLRVGLPWQSVHDGERLAHEPVRLSVLIEAPVEAMNAVIARHPAVAQLLDNGWLHLFAIDDHGAICARYAGGLRWHPVTGTRSQLAA